jgi:hypothetical protein
MCHSTEAAVQACPHASGDSRTRASYFRDARFRGKETPQSALLRQPLDGQGRGKNYWIRSFLRNDNQRASSIRLKYCLAQGILAFQGMPRGDTPFG